MRNEPKKDILFFFLISAKNLFLFLLFSTLSLMSVDAFSTAINYWNGIQLSNLQKELDQQGLTIVENQKDGLVSRKKLAEQTRGLDNIYIYIKKAPKK